MKKQLKTVRPEEGYGQEHAEKYANAARKLSDKDANAFIRELVDEK